MGLNTGSQGLHSKGPEHVRGGLGEFQEQVPGWKGRSGSIVKEELSDESIFECHEEPQYM